MQDKKLFEQLLAHHTLNKSTTMMKKSRSLLEGLMMILLAA